MNTITSLSNSKVIEWSKLMQKKYRDQTKLFIVEGDHLVNEAIKNNLVKEVISIDNDLEMKDFYHVTPEIMKKLSSLENYSSIIAICYQKEEMSYNNKLLLIDSVQDPGNLGTIIRSAVAFNIDTIVIGDNTVDIYNEKVINASEGMIFNINIIKRNLDSFIKEIKEKNYLIIGTDVNNGVELDQINKSDKLAFIVGNEGSGVRKEFLDLCDQKINILINNKCESLNVAVATGIILNYFK